MTMGPTNILEIHIITFQQSIYDAIQIILLYKQKQIYLMTKLKFTSLDYTKFIQTIDSLDSNNNDYTIETDYLDSYYIIIK